jgi:uncharacterized protein YdaU (DUF1376 family)
MNKPWMPLYIADYLADTSHLSAAEHGAYLLLIMHYWRHDGLPKDEEYIRRITKLTTRQWSQSRDVLRSLFGDGWRHKRCDHEIAQAIEKSKVNSANASVSHEVRKANAQRTHTQSHFTVTDTKKEKEEEETRARRAWPFDEFWSVFPNKVGKGAAEKAFEKVRKASLVDFPFLMEALRRYAAKKDDRPWCNPATWLNQSRWTDEPAEAVIGKSLMGALDRFDENLAQMRAGLALDQVANVVQLIPPGPVPEPRRFPGASGNGSGRIRPASGGDSHLTIDGDSEEIEVPAEHRGAG